MPKRFVVTIASGLALAILASWLADILKGDGAFGMDRNGWLDAGHLYVAGTLFAVVVALTLWLARILEGITLYQARADSVDVNADGLVLFVSVPSGGVPPAIAAGATLDSALEDPAVAAHNWSMLLRGLRPHLDTLRACVLVTTGGRNGSDEFSESAAELVRRFARSGTIVSAASGFQRLDHLGTELRLRAIYDELREQGCRRGRVVVDITGGNKTMTISGALSTLSTDAQFQYVDLDENGRYRPRIFDLRADAPR